MCHGEEIEVAHLPDHVVHEEVVRALSDVRPGVTEKKQIEDALRRNLGNRQSAARELHMHRTTLWRKMKEYGIRGQ
jgi:transcriptional regulator of acetoin/glycerol metabolism